jgi:hypothetical protein
MSSKSRLVGFSMMTRCTEIIISFHWRANARSLGEFTTVLGWDGMSKATMGEKHFPGLGTKNALPTSNLANSPDELFGGDLCRLCREGNAMAGSSLWH